MEGLADSIDASLVSLDTRDQRLALRGRVKRLPIPFGLPRSRSWRRRSRERT
ncbi:MAG TPA: hypothetical protein VFZ26_18470 [Gemmatimonadales bacterium]